MPYLAQAKAALADTHPQASPSIVEYVAAHGADVIHLTLRETEDVERDIALLRRVREAIEEFQAGANRVDVRIVTLDGRRPIVRWRAFADAALRSRLSRLLADHAVGRDGRRS